MVSVVTLLGLVALARADDSVFNSQVTFTVETLPVMQYLTDYTRVQVPQTSDISLYKGKYKVGDWLAVTFVRNEGRPLILLQQDHFVPLVCLYQATTVSGPTVFRGCYNNVTKTLPRTDPADAFFQPGGEVYQATRIIAQYYRGTGTVSNTPAAASLFYSTTEDPDSSYCVQETEDSNSPLASWWARFLQFFIPKTQVTVNVPVRVQTAADKLKTVYDIVRYDPLNPPPNITPQVARMWIYLKAFVTNNLPSFKPYLAPDMTFEVIGLANYTNTPTAPDVIYGYQELADFSVSDSIRTNAINLVHIVQQGHIVMVEVMVESDYPHNVGVLPPPLTIWNNKYSSSCEFDRYGLMKSYHQYVNLLDAYIRRTPSRALNSTVVCQTIMQHCTADVIMDQFLPAQQVPAVQFPDFASCLSFMNSIPQQGPVAGIVTSGNSLACRDWHAALAISLPSHHCLHAGPYKYSQDQTPCNDY